MSILKKAVNEQAYLKCGIFGDAGSGKTTTSSYLAMAISNALGNKKPVAFFETEAGSDFLIEKFNAENIELLRVKSHSLNDLIEAAKEAEKSCSCLIVDSITHIWEDLCRSKLEAINAARKKRNLYQLDKLEFQHWSDVKNAWKKWTNLFLNSSLHIIVCGRSGGVWQFETNDETNKKELQKVGSKMKAEGEFGYEPSLLIEMVRVAKGGAAGAGWRHCAYVLKDRTDTINGMKFEFEKPRQKYKAGDWQSTFKAFKPAIEALNIGAKQKTVTETSNASDLFPMPEGESTYDFRKKQVEIVLEEIEETIKLMWPSTDAASKQAKILILDIIFGTRSWAAVQGQKLEDLQIKKLALLAFEQEFKANSINDLESLKTVASICLQNALAAKSVKPESKNDSSESKVESIEKAVTGEQQTLI